MKIYSVIENKHSKIIQLIKFGLVGAVCAALDMLLFVILMEQLQMNYLMSNFISTCIAILANYYISKKWVFKTGKHSSKVELFYFIAFSLVGLVINQLLIWLFVEIAVIDPKPAKLAAIILVAVFNFVTKKLFVFKE